MAYERPVVIVDDDIDHAVIARMVLGTVAPDAAVLTLTDPRGLEASLIAAPQDALVLIDRVLDLAESYPLIRRVGATRPDLRFVMLSAALSAQDATRAREVGVLEAAEKPGSIAGWRELLTRLLHASNVEVEPEGDGDSAVA